MPASTPRKPLFLWHPRALIEAAAEEPLHLFLARLPEMVLVVRLNDFSSELAEGLGVYNATTQRVRPRRVNTISVAWSIPDQTESSAPTSLRPLPPTSERPPSSGEIALELLRSECYVVGIRKREYDAVGTLVTVGRGPDQDIVLQHPSVSRHHALFDTSGVLSIADAGSRNHTFVNGEQVRSQTRLQPGDFLKFGAVRCVVSTPGGVWRAVRG